MRGRAGMSMDQSQPPSFRCTASFIKLASNISAPPTPFCRIERHLSPGCYLRGSSQTALPDITHRYLLSGQKKKKRMENGVKRRLVCAGVSCPRASEHFNSFQCLWTIPSRLVICVQGRNSFLGSASCAALRLIARAGGAVMIKLHSEP